MAKGRKGGRGKGKGKARRAAGATVNIRVANEGAMARKKSGGRKKGSGKRRNPRRKNPGRRHTRRRNPSTFVGALGQLLGAGAVALVAGAGVLYAQNKWAQPTTNASTGVSTPNNTMLYGIPAVAVVGAALLAKKAPTIAVGLATGAIAGPFALAAFSKMSSASTTTPTSTAAAAAHGLSAVQLGELGWVEPMSAVQLGSQAAYAGQY